MLTEQRILKSINVNLQASALEVLWVDQILRDGEVIGETPHRRAFSQAEQADFVAAVPDSESFITAVGWN